MIMRCGRQGWSPRRPNLICHNPSVTAIVSRVRVLLAHQGMSLPGAGASYLLHCISPEVALLGPREMSDLRQQSGG